MISIWKLVEEWKNQRHVFILAADRISHCKYHLQYWKCRLFFQFIFFHLFPDWRSKCTAECRNVYIDNESNAIELDEFGNRMQIFTVAKVLKTTIFDKSFSLRILLISISNKFWSSFKMNFPFLAQYLTESYWVQCVVSFKEIYAFFVFYSVSVRVLENLC